jgi:hypothetical protein
MPHRGSAGRGGATTNSGRYQGAGRQRAEKHVSERTVTSGRRPRGVASDVQGSSHARHAPRPVRSGNVAGESVSSPQPRGLPLALRKRRLDRQARPRRLPGRSRSRKRRDEARPRRPPRRSRAWGTPQGDRLWRRDTDRALQPPRSGCPLTVRDIAWHGRVPRAASAPLSGFRSLRRADRGAAVRRWSPGGCRSPSGWSPQAVPLSWRGDGAVSRWCATKPASGRRLPQR